MRVQSLQLTHFRNYADQTLSFSPGKNIFLGKNGQGKTNLLEALYFLSHARSHRTAQDREMVQTGQPFALVRVHLAPHAYEGHTQLDAQISLQNERAKTIFKVNGNPLRSRSQLLGHLPTVSFFLPDLLLLRGAPEDRRRWLDAAIVQYDKRHLDYLSEFQRVRLQKNRLLKNPPEQISLEHLDTWNVQFAATGAKVIASRQAYLALVEDWAAISYLELSEGQEALKMRYRPSASELGSAQTQAEMEAALLLALNQSKADEIRRGTCLIGPHRDDICFYLNDLDASAYGSQGQQRSVVLALKLTELKCLSAKLQEPPVLLLDDVMAELDPARQRLLVEHMDPQSQVFITTTHSTDTWQQLLNEELSVYQVHGGQVTSGVPQGVGS